MSLSLKPALNSLTDREQRPPDSSFWAQHRVLLMLLLILAAATFFRFYGREFDQGTSQHPDERTVASRTLRIHWPASFTELFDARTSPLNLRSMGMEDNCPATPCQYPYGSLPVYLTRITGWALDSVLPADSPQKGYFVRDFYGVTVLGRHLSSIFDLITILLVFFITRRLYSRNAALVAAALVAFSVTHIQLAHFTTVDSFLTTFMMGALYFSVVLMQRPAWWAAAGLGACVGLAVATKVTVVPFALIVVAAVALRTIYRSRTRKLGAELGDPIGIKPASAEERARRPLAHFIRGLRYVVIAAVFSLFAFAVAEPYVLWSFDLSLLQMGGFDAVKESSTWWTRIVAESMVQSGQGDAPYTRQYVGTVPLLYHLQQLVLWGLGPIPGIVTLVGFVIGIWRAVRRKPAEVLLLTGALPYFATILTLEAKWMRYMLPLVPIFCILGAAFLVRGVDWERHRAGYLARLRAAPSPLVRLTSNAFAALTALTVGMAFLWSVAFMNIYSQDHSREQASQWMYENIPPGKSHSSEVWDDAMPLSGPERYGKVQLPEGGYLGPQTSFDLYPDRPPQEALRYLTEQMGQTEYIVLASNRLYGSLPRLPWRYPVQSRFYELLFAEKLGYVKVHTSLVTPELLGIRFDDQSADESFTVYDHPRVDIFKKVSTLTDDQFTTLFSTALNRPVGEYSQARHGEVSDTKSLAYDQPLASLPDVGDYAWNPLAQEETQWVGVLLWLLAVYVLGIVALPILFLATPNLPDRAYPLSKLLGLLLVSWATWMAANAHVLPFTVWTVALMLLLLGGLGGLAWRLGAGAQVREFLRMKRNLVIFYEVVFLSAFLAFLVIRLLNPDLWQPWQGGEKPMELGFLNATLRSPWMPPADPFFSGGYINYYYYGYFVVGCIVKLVGMDPHIAFNLAIPTLYAMAFSGAASIGYNIVAVSRRERGSLNAVSRVGMAFGVLTAVLMLAIGNLHGLYQLIHIGFPQVSNALLRALAGLGITVPALGTYGSFDFWAPRSIIPFTINEFPFWTYLFADLHPHLIDLPFTILALVLSINLAFTMWRRSDGGSHDTYRSSGWERVAASARAGLADLWGPGWTGVAAFGLFALVLGALAVTNSWDFPTYAAVAGLAVLIALLRLRRDDGDDVTLKPSTDTLPVRSRAQQLRWPIYVACLVSVGALALISLAAYVPFFLSFKAFYTEIIPIVDGGTIPGSLQQMRRTGLADFLLFWAFFIFIALSYLVYRLWRFPWQNAISGWPSLTRLGRSKRIKPEFSTGPALFMQKGALLAPAASMPGGIMAFRSEGLPPSGAVVDRSQSHDGAPIHPPVHTDTDAPPDDTALTERIGDDAENVTEGAISADGKMGQAASADSDLSWGDLTSLDDYKYEPNAPLDGPFYATQEIPNWVAVAHSHAVAAPSVRRATSYTGVLPTAFGVGILAVTAGLVVLQIATGQYLLALLIALFGGIAGTTLADTRGASGLLTGGLLCVALAVAMGVELVYLADHLRGDSSFRMNTVFKFYIQVWVLFAAGGGPAVYYLLFGLRDREPRPTARQTDDKPLTAMPLPEGWQDPPIAATWPLVAADDTVASSPSVSSPLIQQTLQNWLVWTEASVPAEVTANLPAKEDLFPHMDPSPVPIMQPVEAVEPAAAPSVRPRFTPSRIAWLTLFALFLASTLIYTFYGTQDRVNDRFPVHPPIGSLNGMNYMTVGTFTTDAAPLPINLKQDYAAINWMNDNISGLHVIAEVPLGYYREHGMRVASNTGFPMVIGGLHQGEQRPEIYDRLVADRAGDMNEFFTTTDIQRALVLISKYDIEYIYLGQLEHARAGGGIPKFEQMADPKVALLKAVFRTDADLGTPGTIVYQVVKEVKTVVGAPLPDSGNPGIAITPVPTATPTPMPTPPVNDPELNALIAASVANPNDREARIALARWYDQHRFFSDAARELETVVMQEPGNIAARHMLGDAYQAAGQPDKALRAWEQARDVDPNNPAGHNKLGIALNERQRFDDAIAEFQAAVDLDERFVEAWYYMGTAYEGKGDAGKAREAYQNTIDKSAEPNTWSDQARQRLSKLK